MRGSRTVRSQLSNEGQTCFVISPIGAKGTETYSRFKYILDYIIKPAIQNAGHNLKVIRADEIQRSGSIIRDILENVINSYIVIADLTGQNPNVFYELGVRHSLSPRTILIAQGVDFIPSDLREYRTIIYDISAKGVREFEEKLSKYLNEIYNEPNRPDNPVLDKIKQSSDRRSLELAEQAVSRRRSLYCARHGIPHPSVTDAVASHLADPDPELESIAQLPGALSAILELRSTFIFRQNTTQAFRDALEVALFHETMHRSRPGEEGVRIANLLLTDSNVPLLGTLLYSDVDHPALKHVADCIWPDDACSEVTLVDLVFECNRNVSSELVLQRYLSRMREGYVSVVLIPHVVWFNGAVLDIPSICVSIRSAHPLTTIIVDGAQAVGHIPLNIEQIHRENRDIDFYLGCGHKWLCGPETVGFARVGERYTMECRQCRDFLTTSDLLTDASGVSLYQRGEQVGTQQRGLAKGLLQAIKLLQNRKGGIEKVYLDIRQNADMLREIIGEHSSLNSLDSPSNMRSSIVSFSTHEKDGQLLQCLENELDKEGFTPAIYQLPIHPNPDFIARHFCRLSPSPDLTEQDIKRISEIFREVLSNE